MAALPIRFFQFGQGFHHVLFEGVALRPAMWDTTEATKEPQKVWVATDHPQSVFVEI